MLTMTVEDMAPLDAPCMVVLGGHQDLPRPQDGVLRASGTQEMFQEVQRRRHEVSQLSERHRKIDRQPSGCNIASNQHQIKDPPNVMPTVLFLLMDRRTGVAAAAFTDYLLAKRAADAWGFSCHLDRITLNAPPRQVGDHECVYRPATIEQLD